MEDGITYHAKLKKCNLCNLEEIDDEFHIKLSIF